MSESIQVALIVAAGPVLVVLVSHVLSNKKLDHITVLTNSTLTKANNRINTLEHQVAELKNERDKEAQ